MERRRVRLPKPGVPARDRKSKLNFDDVVYGIHVVEEALNAGESLRSIHIADERKRDPLLRTIVADAKERNISVRFEDRAYFAKLPFKTHQGVIAIAPPFDYASLHDVMATRSGGKSLFVLLDHLTDPHNVGAIVRTAECAGADAVILPERRSAGVNATVRKAAAGAAEHLPIAQVANLNDAIRTLKKAGVWVAGAVAGVGAVPFTEADFDRDIAIVIGAEGEGLAQLVRRECDYLVSVPMLGKTTSLNASVSAGVLLYEVVRQRAAKRHLTS
ncbi:MAG: 23S rRNA (guanosine(2251)-2'-O)-methyltransferase RlmB [Candidatus Eremiobacteraeota bacterium]|nr:23S rRNA (guanosine(2251)-2'-O)-methyltransferase RlmB [Candidatus Eremiobacteraeota bacterium]